MRVRPIINQLNFQKINKPQPFFPKDKMQPHSCAPHNSYITLKTQCYEKQPAQTTKLHLQDCIEQLTRQIKHQITMKVHVCCKIRYYLTQLHDNLPDQYNSPSNNFEEIQTLPHKFSSPSIPKPRVQSINEFRGKQTVFSNQNNTLELKKNRIQKFKYTKQNIQQTPLDIRVLEEKFKHVTVQLEKYRLQQQNQRQKIQNLEKKVNQHEREKQALSCKLQQKMRQNEQVGLNYNESHENKDKALGKMLQGKDCIQRQLYERQTQLLNLWQLLLK